MENPLNDFMAAYHRTLGEKLESQAEQQQEALTLEMHRLDELHTYDLAKNAAIRERRVTLALASSLSILLKQQSIRPQVEHIDDTIPVFQQRGFFKKRQVQTGVQSEIVVEGWRLDIAQGGTMDSRPDILLTVDQNTNSHPPLVWYRTWPLTKQSIHPLSSTPLSADDMRWANPTPSTSTSGGGWGKDIVLSHHDDIPAEDDLTPRGSGVNRADYKMYTEARIEHKIRQALVDIAARYEIFEPQANSPLGMSINSQPTYIPPTLGRLEG